MADGLSKVADKLQWCRQPEVLEFDKMAEVCPIAGYCCLDEVMDTSAVERELLYKALIAERPAGARASRKIPDSKAPPIEPKVKGTAFKEVEIYVKLKARNLLSGVGDILRPRREAVNMYSAVLHGAMMAEPLFPAFLQPMLDEVPWAPRNAARNRANELAKARRKQKPARTPFLNSAQLALHFLRYIMTGDVAGAWQNIGGMGAALAHLMELSIRQNMETARRYEKAQHASRAHIARGRGDLDVIKAEFVQISRERLQECVQDQ